MQHIQNPSHAPVVLTDFQVGRQCFLRRLASKYRNASAWMTQFSLALNWNLTGTKEGASNISHLQAGLDLTF